MNSNRWRYATPLKFYLVKSIRGSNDYTIGEFLTFNDLFPACKNKGMSYVMLDINVECIARPL